jgi:1-acyl-sn-glycerol-3-phosphate acyltransferase
MMERQKYFWNPLMDYWFRMEIEGWENLPESPCLLVGVHSGAPLVWDAWTVGGPDSMPVLFSGRRLARLLQLDRIARLKMFPIALSAPWGISPAMLPEIPLPTKIRTAFQPPVELDHDPERASDEKYVEAKYEEVRQSIQNGMDVLARRRAFPLFG